MDFRSYFHNFKGHATSLASWINNKIYEKTEGKVKSFFLYGAGFGAVAGFVHGIGHSIYVGPKNLKNFGIKPGSDAENQSEPTLFTCSIKIVLHTISSICALSIFSSLVSTMSGLAYKLLDMKPSQHIEQPPLDGEESCDEDGTNIEGNLPQLDPFANVATQAEPEI